MSAIVFELFNQQRPREGLRHRVPLGTPLVIAPGAVLTVVADTDDDGQQTPFWTIKTKRWQEFARFEAHTAINAAGLGWHIYPLAREIRAGRLVAVHLQFHPVPVSARAVLQ